MPKHNLHIAHIGVIPKKIGREAIKEKESEVR